MSALEDKIHEAARKRQAAWALGDRALNDQLTADLERLYAKHRTRHRAEAGAPFTGRSSSFVSMRSRSPRPWRVAR